VLFRSGLLRFAFRDSSFAFHFLRYERDKRCAACKLTSAEVSIWSIVCFVCFVQESRLNRPNRLDDKIDKQDDISLLQKIKTVLIQIKDGYLTK
jgi:hypothetical protein